MRTRRKVRGRRRPRAVISAMMFLMVSMAMYVRVSLPVMMQMRIEDMVDSVEHGERVTQEVTFDKLEIYLISFGEYPEESDARIEAGRYVPRGAAGYILNGEHFFVIGAGYEDGAKADRVCTQLAASEGIPCTTVKRSASALTMRMTAGKEQIEAFRTGEQVLRNTAAALGQLALSVDRREANVEQAQAVIQTHLHKVENVAQTLKAQTEGTDNPVFMALIQLLDDMGNRLESMAQEERAMGLSSRLKYCHIDCSVRQIEWMNGLGR